MSQELSDKEISNAFDKLKITSETEGSIKENSDNLGNGIKTMILDSIDKLRGKEKRPDIDSTFDILSETVATNIDRDTLADSIWQLITLKVLVNKKTPNGYDSFYLSNLDQREIKPTQETKSGKIDDDSVQALTLNTSKETSQFPIQTETPLLQNVKQIPKPSTQQKTLTFEQFETLLTHHLEKSLTEIQEKIESYLEKISKTVEIYNVSKIKTLKHCQFKK